MFSGQSPTALVAAGVAALLLVWALAPVALPLLRRLKFGQSIREEGPQRHLTKAGTPTMGGLLFLVAVPVALVLLGALGELRWTLDLVAAVGLFLGFGLIGFADDFIKVALKRPLGLRAREKLLGQVALSVALAVVARRLLGLPAVVALPFGLGFYDLGWLYPVLVALVVIGASNAVNLTDGLDGLAAGASAIAYAAYGLVALGTGQYGLAVFCAATVGAMAGFLRYNWHPARVFMGDTGSMALGGGLGALAVLTKTEFLLPLIGGLFVIEALSVIVQVISYRTTGRRVFRMSPLHHHFELVGWPETSVVRRFWLFGGICALFGLAGLGGLGR